MNAGGGGPWNLTLEEAMSRITRDFTSTDSLTKSSYTSTAYSDDNGRTWKWASNDRHVPLDACRSYGIPCDPVAQEADLDAANALFLAEYRKAMANHVPTAEERGEMRNAFGPGKTVVNVVTGRKYRT